jgi:hypothetical protein
MGAVRDFRKAALVHWAAVKLRVSKRSLYRLLASGVVTEDEIRQMVVPWPGKFVSVGELAEVCKRSEKTIQRWLLSGALPYVQFCRGGFLRIPETMVDRCISLASGGDYLPAGRGG